MDSGQRTAAEPEPPPLDDAALALAALLRADGFEPRTDLELGAELGLAERELGDRLRALEGAGQAVRVGRSLHFHHEPLAALEERVVALAQRDGQATIAAVRDELGTSRKYAQALLEHLDAARVTLRLPDDRRVLRRRGGGS